MATASTTVMSVADLNKEIDACHSGAQKVQMAYQACAVHVLERLGAHGDVGPVNRLILGMPKSTRRLAMSSWLLAYGAVVLNTDKSTMATMPFKFSKDKTTDPDAAALDMWYDHMPEKAIQDTFDLQVAIRALIHRAKGKTLMIGGEVHTEAAAALLKAMAAGAGIAYEGEQKAPTEAAGALPEGVEEDRRGVVAAVAAAAPKEGRQSCD
jgi:hypothetical protein